MIIVVDSYFVLLSEFPTPISHSSLTRGWVDRHELTGLGNCGSFEASFNRPKADYVCLCHGVLKIDG